MMHTPTMQSLYASPAVSQITGYADPVEIYLCAAAERPGRATDPADPPRRTVRQGVHT